MSRKIDVLVAEHIMGWKTVVTGRVGSSYMYVYEPPSGETSMLPPQYSTNIAAAYEVMTKMYDYGIRIEPAGGRVDRWSVRFPEYEVRAVHQSLPMAICLAVLKLEGVEYEVE